jgi:hypothetical protein
VRYGCLKIKHNFSSKQNFQLVQNHGIADREKNLQDAEIWLEDVPHMEHSPSIEQFFWLTWAKAMGSTPHLQSSFLELIWLV